MPPELVLTDASRRLRRKPGRPRTVTAPSPGGLGVQSATPGAAKSGAISPDFAHTLLPRGLPLPAAATYSGIPVRSLWRLIAEGKLARVRVPGCRRVLILRDELDNLLLAHRSTS
jgi:excisionase family DNA binding protein